MNKKKPRKIQENGIRQPNYEELLEGVRLDELKARHWRAQWETAYYHIEFEKILPEYKELLARKEEEAKEAREKLKSQFDELIAANKAKPVEKEMIDVLVDEDTLKVNPELAEQGIKIGDTIQVPKDSDLSPEEEELAEAEFREEHPELFNK